MARKSRNPQHLSKKVMWMVILGALVIMLPVMVFLLSQQTNLNQHAAASTTLSFSPSSSGSSPISTSVGKAVPLDVMVDPGTNQVSTITLVIDYDSTKFAASDAATFVPNSNLTVMQGPIYAPGKISVALSIGADPTKAITQPTKVGTVLLQPINNTTTPTSVTFDTSSQVLSIAPSDSPTENVLSTTIPAYISIGNTTTAQTNLTFNLYLDGVGLAGDNTSPYTPGNMNPVHPLRLLQVKIYDSSNNLVKTATGGLVYYAPTGSFIGNVNLGSGFQTGYYFVKVMSPRYLWKLLTGVQSITANSTTKMPKDRLIVGDANGDNMLNNIDYNLITSCLQNFSPTPVCNSTLQYMTDLNDDGIVNNTDLNLFRRETVAPTGAAQ